MSTIGMLRPTTPGKFDEFVGQILTLDLDLSIRLVANEPGGSDQAPSHLILSKNNVGREIQIGSAWTKTIQSAQRYGEQFLSLTLDDPSFGQPLNVAAFKVDGRDFWDVTWRRRQDRVATDAQNDR